jgi:nucleolar protein 56
MTFISSFLSDNPTSKFGEALRSQVEERLNFFETGAPPSKNADAMRKVLDALHDEDEDVDMDAEPALTTLEPSPKKEKKKKRKSDAMDVDGDDSAEEPSPKKVKLSKEEKKALKKAKKEAKKAKGGHENEAVSGVSCGVSLVFLPISCVYRKRPRRKER